MDLLLDLIDIGKYIIGAMGLLGLIMLIAGIYKRQAETIQRGALILLAAIILFICGYLVIRKTNDKIQHIEEEIYYNNF
ncbi:hypothetical protein D0T53_09575 [Dysgonomonas sp. 216]|uniref:PepSY domain-containing protein n=1 Tax=Dysgonomonas sp. 216 TaxID=2302934 RepID=UPI0013D66221|nr:PepSY domain-containing protein [Dysgonomonas sp. 216]NDW19160.1 hypothetical protein [Dysgonomonas sp. 216]